MKIAAPLNSSNQDTYLRGQFFKTFLLLFPETNKEYEIPEISIYELQNLIKQIFCKIKTCYL